MRTAVCMTCVACAGFASGVYAQDFSISISGPSTIENGVFTLNVIGDSTFGTHMLGGGFSLETNSSLITDMTWHPASWSSFNEDGGYQGNGNYGDVVFGQLLLPIPGFDVPAAGSELGGLIGSFQVSYISTQLEVIDFQLVAASPFTLEAVDASNGLATAQDVDGVLWLGGASVLVPPYVPAPSVLALLGLSGVVTSRRRR